MPSDLPPPSRPDDATTSEHRAPEQPHPTGGRSRRSWGRIGTAASVAILVLSKAKFLIPALKFAKLGTLISMIVSVWAYAQFWGAPFAIGFVLLIFVHELGHALVLRHQGIPSGAPVFIPFLGAVIAMKGMPRNAWVEALVGIGGPVLGTAGAVVCLVIGYLTDAPIWYALASTGFLINLFNLLPISPLDGGRIVGVMSRWIWVAGYALGIWIFLVTFHPVLLLILVFGIMGLGRAIKGPHASYYDVAPGRRVAMGAAYFGLAGFLALAMWVTDQQLRGIGL